MMGIFPGRWSFKKLFSLPRLQERQATLFSRRCMNAKVSMRRFYTMAGYLAAFVLTVGSCDQKLAPHPAEEVVENFWRSFSGCKWSEAASCMHPDALAQFQGMFVQIAETTQDEKERDAFLKMYGDVKSTDDLKKLDQKVFFERTFLSIWENVLSDETKEVWSKSRAEVVGSVHEGELVHVVFRTKSQVRGRDFSVISVATAKRHGGQWKLLTTTEFEAMIEKLRGLSKH